jgi:hypothetical protein
LTISDFPSTTLNKIQDTLKNSDQLLGQFDHVEEKGRRILEDLGASKTEKLDVADLVSIS